MTHEEQMQNEAYRRLASSVITFAVEEKDWRFLAGDLAKPARELWLGWLGKDDQEFQRMLRMPEFLEHPNKLLQ